MGYEETVDRLTPLYPLAKGQLVEPPAKPRKAKRDTVASIGLSNRRCLRFGGLSLDTLTGATQWRGKTLPISEDEVEVLQVLMQNAGRIMSTAQLAIQLGDSPETTERRIRALHASLRVAGARCLPRHAEGLGYVLWH